DEASEQRKENARKRIAELTEVVEKYAHLKPLVTTRLRDILEKDVDEKYYLDDEKTAKLVAQLEDVENESVLGGTQTNAYKGDGSISPTLTGAMGAGGGHTPLRVEESPQMLGHVDLKGNDSIKRTYSTEGISPTFTTMGGGHREPKIAEEQSVITPVQYNRKDGIGKELEQANTLSASDWRGLNRNQNQNAILEEVRPVLTPDRMEKRQNGRRFKEDGE